MDYKKDPQGLKKALEAALGGLLLNFLGRPDFIAYNWKDLRKLGFRFCRKIFGVKTAAWTVKSENEETQIRESGYFDMLIFDSYEPECAGKFFY